MGINQIIDLFGGVWVSVGSLEPHPSKSMNLFWYLSFG